MKKGLFLLLFAFAFSCNHEEIIDTEQLNNKPEVLTIREGRLQFTSKESLQNKLDELETNSFEDVYNHFQKLYKSDFLSFRPIFNSNDIEQTQALLAEYKERPTFTNVFQTTSNLKSKSTEDIFDSTKAIIADDEFAAFLNENGEIQIGDTLYKYTESGLYFIHIKDEDHLNKYLSQNKSSISNELIEDNKTKKAALTEQVKIDDKITRFRVIDNELREPIGSTGGGSTPYVLKKLPKEFKDFPETSGRQTWLGGIFGDRRAAHAYFSSHRRVKVMYFNQRYLIASRLGIEVKYQKKGTGIWSSYKADELALGINQAFFALDYKTSNFQKVPKSIIFYNDHAYNDHFQIIQQTQNIGTPKFPFQDEVSITINLPLYGWNAYSYSPEAINNMVWNIAFNQIENLMKSLQKPMPEKISVVALSPEKLYINHIDLSYRKYNSRYIKRIFNREFQTPTIILGYNNAGQIQFKEIGGLPDLMKASAINLDFYGGAKRGDTWKGYRMIFKD
ncbi:hypothetical protein [Marinifilum fragile]|uniref:hypothetical protein n=1 Tax=Marinifilum fragile TaxID=570161 RepID=UPI002AA65235|nr:hypothetical protein [Marinifilum fragile]